jgi:hypothetical protein
LEALAAVGFAFRTHRWSADTEVGSKSYWEVTHHESKLDLESATLPRPEVDLELVPDPLTPHWQRIMTT